jgi:hypothetical protein
MHSKERRLFIAVHTIATGGGRTKEIVGHTEKERAQKSRAVLSPGWHQFLGTFAEFTLFCKGYDSAVHLWHDFLGSFGVVADCTGPYSHSTISKTAHCFSFLGGFLAGREISSVFKCCYKGCCNSAIFPKAE